MRGGAMSSITAQPGWLTRAELVRRYAERAGCDVSNLTDACHCSARIAAGAIHRAHNRVAPKPGGPPAGLLEGLKQALPLRSLGEHPAEFDADARHRQIAPSREVEDLRSRLPPLGCSGKVNSPQLDGIPAGATGNAQDLGEGGRVKRPRVKRQSSWHGTPPDWRWRSKAHNFRASVVTGKEQADTAAM
jgi:hypothetical protein